MTIATLYKPQTLPFSLGLWYDKSIFLFKLEGGGGLRLKIFLTYQKIKI